MTISLKEDLMKEQKNPIGINIYYNKNLTIDKRIKTICKTCRCKESRS